MNQKPIETTELFIHVLKNYGELKFSCELHSNGKFSIYTFGISNELLPYFGNKVFFKSLNDLVLQIFEIQGAKLDTLYIFQIRDDGKNTLGAKFWPFRKDLEPQFQTNKGDSHE